jgi:quinate dehydrogenase
MPHKVTLVSAVDHVTEEGRLIGAINTVFVRKTASGTRTYIGTNTDCVGVREAFLQNFPDVRARAEGKAALVIGAGGASRAAVYALWKWLGARKIYIVNRLESEAAAMIASFREADAFTGELVWVGSVEQARELETPVLVVGTVPDLVPMEEGEIVARDVVDCFLGGSRRGLCWRCVIIRS